MEELKERLKELPQDVNEVKGGNENPYTEDIRKNEQDQGAVSGVKSPSKIDKFKKWFQGLSTFEKVVSVGGGSFGILIILGGIVFGLKLDFYLFPSSLSGYVMDVEGEPIKGAKVCVNEKCS